MIDIHVAAEALINKHISSTNHLSPLIRGSVRIAYREGIKDCLAMMQDAAIRAEVESHKEKPDDLPSTP